MEQIKEFMDKNSSTWAISSEKDVKGLSKMVLRKWNVCMHDINFDL